MYRRLCSLLKYTSLTSFVPLISASRGQRFRFLVKPENYVMQESEYGRTDGVINGVRTGSKRILKHVSKKAEAVTHSSMDCLSDV